jgi:glycosyltransferase involved in cell wall biosynthesis
VRILIVYRHFWPDSPPYASMLRTLGRSLADDGHDVTIWAEQPCYKSADRNTRAPRREQLDGIAIERMPLIPGARRFAPLQIVDKIAFPLRAVIKALWRRLRGDRYDLVWTATIPPIAAGLAGRVIADLFGARFLYHCQDLYPEIAGHTGLWRRGGLTYRIAETIERRTRRRADLLVTLSEDMADTVREMAEPKRLAVINNFMLEDFSKSGLDRSPALPVATAPRNDGKIQIIFAGNLGQFQGLEAVVDAMRLIEQSRPDLELVLMGEGKALPGLRERAAGLANVRFEPHRPFEDAQRLIATADVGLVSLEPGIYRYAFPSKTLTYLGLGLPILAIVELESKLAESIRQDELGWVAPANNPDVLGDLLSTLEIRDGDNPRGRLTKALYRPTSPGTWLQEIGFLA